MTEVMTAFFVLIAVILNLIFWCTLLALFIGVPIIALIVLLYVLYKIFKRVERLDNERQDNTRT